VAYVGALAQQWGGQAGQSPGSPDFQAINLKKNNFPVTVKIRTSRNQTLECFVATLRNGRLVHVGET